MLVLSVHKNAHMHEHGLHVGTQKCFTGFHVLELKCLVCHLGVFHEKVLQMLTDCTLLT